MADESQKPQTSAVRQINTSRNRTTDAGAGGGKYSIDQLTYPQDLFAPGGLAKYNNAWMMININMLQQSKYLKETTTVDLTDEEKQREMRNYTNAQSRGNTPAGAAAKAAAVAGGVKFANEISKLDFSKYIAQGMAAGPAAAAKSAVRDAAVPFGKALGTAAVAGGAVGVVTGLAGTATRETKRIAAAIQLPMPNRLTTRYEMQWDSDNTAMFDAIMRGLESVSVDAAAAASLATQNIINAQGLSAATGLASNPKKEMYFQSVNFRQFDIEYVLYPKTPKEAEVIRNIIFMLKFHMHPEYKSEGRYTFVYPSEFDITFYQSGRENEWVNKIATCVLTSLDVNYTPDGWWVAHDQGQPNAINIRMTFKELATLTKEMIDEGY